MLYISKSVHFYVWYYGKQRNQTSQWPINHRLLCRK